MSFEAIRTERLLLRPVRATDADALAARRSEPEVAEYQNWIAPYPLDRAETMVAELVAMDGPADGEWWMVTIADADDTIVLGDLVVHLTWGGRTAEIGYTLARGAWGHGYALEAAEALVEYLFDDVGVTRIEGMLHPDNPASAMVLERLGLLFEGHTRSSFWLADVNSDDWLYGMVRSDWEAWRGRPRTRPANVELVTFSNDELDDVVGVRTHKSQERFVWPVVDSLAEALIPPIDNGAPLEPWFRAVRADGDWVGFVMLSLANDVHPDTWLWRLVVDRMHQRRGIGSAVIDLVADECRRRGDRSILTSWSTGKGSPEPLYLSRGFVPTGDLDDGEIVARLDLG